MSPLVYLLVAIGAAALAFSGMLGVIMLYVGWRDRREQRYWQEQRRRLAAYHERAAATNGRPYAEVTSSPRRRPS